MELKSGCKICGQAFGRPYKLFPDRSYYRCSSCRTISLVPEPSAEQLRYYYNAMPANYREAIVQSGSNAKKFSYFFDKYVRPIVPPGERSRLRLLDVGCFNGDFLEQCRNEGFEDVHGYEINETAKNTLKSKGIDFLETDFLTIGAIDTIPYDIISMLDFIEHVSDPLGYLSKAFELLKKGGVLVVTSPDSSSILARGFWRHWPVFDGMEHLHIFARRTMEQILLKLGFRDVKSRALWKRTTIDYFFNIISAWRSKTKPGGQQSRRQKIFGQASITFHAGEFVIVAHKQVRLK